LRVRLAAMVSSDVHYRKGVVKELNWEKTTSRGNRKICGQRANKTERIVNASPEKTTSTLPPTGELEQKSQSLTVGVDRYTQVMKHGRGGTNKVRCRAGVSLHAGSQTQTLRKESKKQKDRNPLDSGWSQGWFKGHEKGDLQTSAIGGGGSNENKTEG